MVGRNPSTQKTSMTTVSSPWDIFSQPLSNTWLPELSTLCPSIVSLAVIGVVVFIYDDHAAPTLPHGVSLNAIVSVLATISKSALIFVVAACISQLKWPWYQAVRRLNDLQLLDDASRGPLGSVKLLTTRLLRSSASIGALITLLALELDPFLQQLIAYPVKEVYTDSTSASVRRANSFHTTRWETSFAAAINAGMWSDPSMQPPVCPTGNCTWPEYTSVVWCSKCGDVTATSVLRDCDLEALNVAVDDPTAREMPCRVELADDQVIKAPITVTVRDGAQYRLNCSHYVVVPISIIPTYTHSSEWQDSADYGDYLNTTGTYFGIENPVIAMGHAMLNLDPADSAYVALPFSLQSVEQCILDICFADYAVSVSKGTPTETRMRTQHGVQFQKKLPVLWPSSLIELNTTYHCWRQPDTPEASLELKSIYDPQFDDLPACGVWVDTLSRGFCLEVGTSNCREFIWAQEISKRLTTYEPHEYTFFANGTKEDVSWAANDLMQHITYSGLENVTSTIAASLTNLAFSQAQLKRGPNPNIDPNLNIVTGHVGSSVTYVKVRFEWMILPALLEVAAIVLLITTIRSTKKKAAPLWKESILALLSHGFEENLRGFGARRDDAMTVAEMEEQAEEIKVCLRMTEKGYGFARDADVEQQSDASTPVSRSSTQTRPLERDCPDRPAAPTS